MNYTVSNSHFGINVQSGAWELSHINGLCGLILDTRSPTPPLLPNYEAWHSADFSCPVENFY